MINTKPIKLLNLATLSQGPLINLFYIQSCEASFGCVKLAGFKPKLSPIPLLGILNCLLFLQYYILEPDSLPSPLTGLLDFIKLPAFLQYNYDPAFYRGLNFYNLQLARPHSTQSTVALIVHTLLSQQIRFSFII